MKTLKKVICKKRKKLKITQGIDVIGQANKVIMVVDKKLAVVDIGSAAVNVI